MSTETQFITALGPNDQDDGDEGRQRRGLAISALTKIGQNQLGYMVPSQSGKGDYMVALGDAPFCTCPDFESRQAKCKHVYAVEFTVERETASDGSTTVTESVQVTKTSEWTIYNQAQTHEAERFSELLQDLCAGIPNPPQTTGRPRLPLSDVVYSLASRAYSTKSGRRHASELREAEANGVITKAPSYNSAFRYLENPDLTPLLKSLIEETAKPLAGIEDDFAVDSSGFSTTTYNRWYDHKWGKERSRASWVKTHIMVGVKTHVVTSVEATPTESADSKQLPYLLERTSKSFDIGEVSADKAYSDHKNVHAIQDAGGTAYIPFRSNSTGQASSKHSYDSLWHRMWAFYNFNRADFNAHYHKRSNVETAFSMIKAKFGGSVRAKSPTAQVNEVLCKILCHNICVLIQSIYELELEPTFWGFEAEKSVAPKQFSFAGF
ncbi:MAG: IS5 family transposase [SAR202 cluster bacterium]|nr:IS5 family transposase [SAR202 cluster bacterium]